MSADAYRQACARCDELRQELEALKQKRRMAKLSWVFDRVLTPPVLFGVGSVAVVLFSAPAIVRALNALPAPRACRDSAEIISVVEMKRSCDEGAAVSTEPVPPNEVLVRCTCLRPGGGP